MNSRPLTEDENRTLEVLRALGHECALLFLTPTGLRKSILDATFPVRQVLKNGGIHDYSTQAQGQEAKHFEEALWIGHNALTPLRVSLYRPEAKQGDPRLWPGELSLLARAGDVIAMFVVNARLPSELGGSSSSRLSPRLHLLNLTLHPLRQADARSALEFLSSSEAIERRIAPIIPIGLRRRTIPEPPALGKCLPLERDAISYVSSTRVGISTSASVLLQMIRDVARKGPIRATCKGPTAIGRAIESALGIPINSSRIPDFHGIEIKSSRISKRGRGTRLTLFACVPDWTVSQMKSSAQILARYGYVRNGARRLYCQVSAKSVNSQGLSFEIDEKSELLLEKHELDGPVATWPVSRLSKYLTNKHPETFWIKAQRKINNKDEWFTLESIDHTQSPSTLSLVTLLGCGIITMDHLIKQANGRTSEKGPLFKIERNELDQLFVAPIRQYKLG